MAVPSNPGWKYGYVPSPGEWNNTFAGKVDYPAPLDQGGTGGQTAFDGNYNLQQRVEVTESTSTAAGLTFYSVRTDLTAATIALPPAASLKPGDWIDLFDSGFNAAANNIKVNAAGADTITSGVTTAASLLLQNNGVRCTLIVTGANTWRAQIAAVASLPPIPQQIVDDAYTLQIGDAGQYLQFTSSDPVTITVPVNTAVPFALGIVVILEQTGLGKLTVVADSGVIVNGHNDLTSGGQYAVLQLKNGMVGSADTWTLLGDAGAA